jgi:TolB-like protein
MPALINSVVSANESEPEIAYVLFVDLVGYSKRVIEEQRELLQRLNEIIRNTNEFRAADAAGKLIRIATGDGVALVFFGSPQSPAQCALELSEALRSYPDIQLRMGIHAGPVHQIRDVNDRLNVAGAGIDLAQRVMECGDAGHILLSKRIADDLAPHQQWRPRLHEVGEAEVKHGVKISLVNLYTEKIGNPGRPTKCDDRRRRTRGGLAVIIIAAIAAGAAIFIYQRTPHSDAALAKGIAVLPFENLSADPTNAYFADGIQDEILTRLASIGNLKVISRTSTQRYKNAPPNLSEIARQLGVANVLEGTVQRAGDQIRVNVQLINAQNASHLWAETFDRRLIDIFAVESEIANKIAQTLQTKLSALEQKAITAQPAGKTRIHAEGASSRGESAEA